MTNEHDVSEIANLKARYVEAVDGGWSGERPHDPDAVVALFVPDGVWDSGAYGGGQGHEGIREFMATGEAIMPFAFHHLSAPRIEIAGDRATGRWHAILLTTVESGAKLQAGIYDDRFVRTPEGWRFERLGFALCATNDLPAAFELF